MSAEALFLATFVFFLVVIVGGGVLVHLAIRETSI